MSEWDDFAARMVEAAGHARHAANALNQFGKLEPPLVFKWDEHVKSLTEFARDLVHAPIDILTYENPHSLELCIRLRCGDIGVETVVSRNELWAARNPEDVLMAAVSDCAVAIKARLEEDENRRWSSKRIPTVASALGAPGRSPSRAVSPRDTGPKPDRYINLDE